jgi:hypothetical protein
MHYVAKVAVIGSGSIAHHRIDLRGIGDRQSGASEPHCRIGMPTTFFCQLTYDARGFEVLAARCAGDRAGHQHRRMIDRLWRQVRLLN